MMRCLWTNNPLYVIGASLFLYGICLSIGAADTRTEPWILLALLGGYTILLASAGVWVVRLGGVWDDARTIFLLVVLLAAAVSMLFDDVLIVAPLNGIAMEIVGLVGSILVVEISLRAIKVRLSASLRLSAYGLLAEMYLYPCWLALCTGTDDPVHTAWRVFGFFPAAAIGVSFLLPVARKGRAQPAEQGTPWSWPSFPWAAIGLLICALCIRGYLLSVSFDPVPTRHGAVETSIVETQTIFDGYFLIPILFALNVLLLEGGIAAKAKRAQTVALAVPAGLILLSMPRATSPAAERFLAEFLAIIGSPILWTVSLGGLFYLFAWWRGLRPAQTGLAISLAALAIVDHQTVDFDTLAIPRTLPVAGLALLWTLDAVQRGGSAPTYRAVLAAIATLATQWSLAGRPVDTAIVFAHLILAATLAVGLVHTDRFARFLRFAGAVAMGGLCLAELRYGAVCFDRVPVPWHAAYLLMLLAATWLIWALGRDPIFLAATLFSLGACLVSIYQQASLMLNASFLEDGIRPMFWGILLLAAGFLVSLAKGNDPTFHQPSGRQPTPSADGSTAGG